MSSNNTNDTKASEPSQPDVKKLYRLPASGKVAGVCAGLAEYFEMDVTLLRIIFVVFALASGGFGVLVYLILAIAMPVTDAKGKVRSDSEDIGENFSNLAAEIRDSGGVDRLRNFFGAGLILFGAWLLLVQFFPQWLSLNWSYVWPSILILIGLILVTRTRR